MAEDVTFESGEPFAKKAADGSEVAGWLYVTHDENGEVSADHSGDSTSIQELTKAAHRFMSESRIGKTMHDGDKTSDVVEGVMIDDDFAKAHGITHKKRGFWIKKKINCPETRARVVSGELRSFSMGGKGKRVRIAQ